MNNFDWYLGTDESGEVPVTIEAVMNRMDLKVTGVEDISRLRSCLDKENEPNWRGFLLGLIGLIFLGINDVDRARNSFLRAMEFFDIAASSFEGVSNVYCQCCYSIGTIYFGEGEADLAFSFFTRCLANMYDVYDDVFIGNIFLFMDLCMNERGDYPAAVAFSENAVIATGGSIDALESLMISQFNAGLVESASNSSRRILERCEDQNTLERVHEFAARNLA